MPTEALYDALSAAFAPAGGPLEALCDATGRRWGTTHPDLFWFRAPGFHVFESLLVLPLLWLLYRAVAGPYMRSVVSDQPRRGKPTSASDTALGGVFLACVVMQILVKGSRPNPCVQLAWLVMPCHVFTTLWAFVLLSPPSFKNMAQCRLIASILSICSWGGVMASAFPDWSDHNLKIEGLLFFFQHGALLIAPHYWAAKHGLLPMSHGLFWTYIFFGFGINFYVYTPLSYLSGLNVNYNLHPHAAMLKAPSGGLAASKWYRFVAPTALSLFGLVYWAVAIRFGSALYRAVAGVGNVASLVSPVGSAARTADSVSPAPSHPSLSVARISTSRTAAGAGTTPRKRTASATAAKKRAK